MGVASGRAVPVSGKGEGSGLTPPRCLKGDVIADSGSARGDAGGAARPPCRTVVGQAGSEDLTRERRYDEKAARFGVAPQNEVELRGRA